MNLLIWKEESLKDTLTECVRVCVPVHYVAAGVSMCVRDPLPPPLTDWTSATLGETLITIFC